MEPLNTNRFPIFAAWCYTIARRLGYNEDEAKSLAVTRAKLGAAARGGMLGHGSHTAAPRAATGGSHRRGRDAGAVDQVAFVGMRPFVAAENGHLRGVLSREIVPPRQYDSSVIRKLGDAYPEVIRVLEALAAALSPEELNARGYHLWERFAPMVRDAQGRESRPRFGQRALFEPAKVAALTSEIADEPRRHAA